ncbi:MAG: hypothetical protein U0174_06820 [Polyangiaceae bacterium]
MARSVRFSLGWPRARGAATSCTSALAFSFVLLSATEVLAEPEVTGDTAVQWYDVRSPSGQTLLTRRRLTTTLGVSGYDLLSDDAKPPAEKRGLRPMLTFRSRLRYDADYGAKGAEATPTDPSSYVPGFERGPVDLMYAYIEGRRLPFAPVSFRLGRQIQLDALGYWQMDGGWARLDVMRYLAIEGYGGLEVRGGFPMSTSRAERDGIWRGSRDGLDPSAFTSFVDRGLAPAYGAALESNGIDFLHARVAYRHVDSTGTVTTNPFSGETTTGTRLSQERLAFGVDLSNATLGGVKTGLVHDLLTNRLSNAFVSVDAYAGSRVTLSADWDFYQPTFDGDSIFNFFATAPMHHGEARSNIQLDDRWSVSGGASLRGYDATSESSGDLLIGGNAAARYVFPSGRIGLRADVARGGGSHRAGGDLFIEKLLEARYILSGRVSAWDFRDSLRADRGAQTFGYVAGAGYRLGERSRVLLEFEHNMNRLVGQRYRVVLWLTVAMAQ